MSNQSRSLSKRNKRENSVPSIPAGTSGILSRSRAGSNTGISSLPRSASYDSFTNSNDIGAVGSKDSVQSGDNNINIAFNLKDV